MRRVYRILRAVAVCAQTSSESPSRAGRVVRGLWVIAPFGLAVLLLRVWYRAFGSVDVQVTTPESCTLTCELPDMIPLYIATFGTWEPDVASLIRQHLREGDVFVDVGANIGFDALLAARCVGPRGDVVAVEADPQIYASLERNIAQNEWASNVRATNCAASDQHGELRIERSFEHNRGRTRAMRVPDARQSSGETIASLPLSDILTHDEATRTRIIKIDVEGGEPAVLRGLLPILDVCPEDVLLLVELSPQWWEDAALRPIDVLDPLLSRGFMLYSVPNNYWPWRYMWPRFTSAPVRYSGSLTEKPRRVDLVMSRVALP